MLSLSKKVNAAAKNGESPDWWAIYAAGCTRDQGGLPYNISSEEQIRDIVEEGLIPLLKSIPPPVLITVARSTDDGYCPADQVGEDLFLSSFTIKRRVASKRRATTERVQIGQGARR